MSYDQRITVRMGNDDAFNAAVDRVIAAYEWVTVARTARLDAPGLPLAHAVVSWADPEGRTRYTSLCGRHIDASRAPHEKRCGSCLNRIYRRIMRQG